MGSTQGFIIRLTVVGLPLAFAGTMVMALICPVSARQVKASAQTIPVIVNSGGDESAWLLGGWSNGKWIEQEKLGKRLRGGEKYTLYSQTKSIGSVSGNKPFTYKGEPGEDQFNVKLTGAKSPNETTIGIGGKVNALPRPTFDLNSGHSNLLNVVRQILREHQLANAKPKIRRAIRVDLDGDDVYEVLIEAGNGLTDPPSPGGKANDYSFIALQQPIGGKVKTTLLDGEFHAKADSPEGHSAPNIHHLLHLIDLNGDGVLEIVTSWKYYEGNGYVVFALVNGKPKAVLSAGISV